MALAWSRMRSGIGEGREFVTGGMAGGTVGGKGRETVAGGIAVVW